MSKRTLWAVAVVGVLAVLPLACKKQDTPTQFGFNTDPNATATNTTYGQPTATAPTATATTTPTATATATAPDLIGQIGGMVGGILGGLGGDPLAAGISYNAQQNAAGMRAEGSPVKLQLAQNQTAEGQITLTPGKCYTLVGASMPGVLDVSVQATMPAPLQTQVLGQNTNTGPMPIVWPKDSCYRHALPMPMPIRIAVTMKSGSGMVAIQPYVK